MQLAFRHNIEYTLGVASIDEVIENLKAQKKLIEEGCRLIEASIPGFDVNKVVVRVRNVEEGSLRTDLIVVLFSTYQKDVQRFVSESIEKMFGIEVPKELEPLVTIAVALAALSVARFAVNKIFPVKSDKKEPSININGDYNTLINLYSDKIGVSVNEVEETLRNILPPQKSRSLVRSVTKFLRPREDGQVSSIKIDGVGEIKEDTIREYPSDAQLAQIDDSRNLDLPSAIIDIRATDKDKNSTGWAGRILGDSRFKTRLPMDLYPTVDAVALAMQERVTADITLEGETKPDGSFKARKIHLLKVISTNKS